LVKTEIEKIKLASNGFHEQVHIHNAFGKIFQVDGSIQILSI